MLSTVLKIVESGGSLSQEQMAEAIGRMMDGVCEEEQIARFLVGLHRKGETAAEVIGAAAAMRSRMTPIRSPHANLLDTCGTGGDGSRTFNISTATAIVAAAAGVPVAKHGNRAATSRTGSADVLSALGVHVEADASRVEACLAELGICFCFAPTLHSAMRHVATVRRRLHMPTIFNLLGPLANPASAQYQLVGVGRSEFQPLLAESLLGLGVKRALVVQGLDGLDEVTLDGPTRVVEVADGRLRSFEWQPADFGLQPAGREEMLVSGPQESADMIHAILQGRAGPPRDIVVLNAAAALWTVDPARSPKDCARLAAEAIDQGAASQLLGRLAAWR